MVSGWFETTLAQTVLAERKRKVAHCVETTAGRRCCRHCRKATCACSVYFLKWSLCHLCCACHKRKPFRIYPKRISASAHAFRHFDYCRSWFRLLVHFDYIRSLKFCVWANMASSCALIPRTKTSFGFRCSKRRTWRLWAVTTSPAQILWVYICWLTADI